MMLSSSAALLLADHGVVVTKDGSTYEGDVREDEQNVVVVIRGIETRFPRADVERIDYGDFEKDFRDQLTKLGPNDVVGRIALARTAFDRRRYDLAREAVADAQRIDPNSREAADMMDLIDRTQRLERSGQPTEPPRGGGGAATPAPATARGTPPAERRLLSAEDVNTIRQKELKPTDTGVRITFQGDVKKRFAEHQNLRFADFNRQAPVEQAMQILSDGDDEMRRQVRVTSDPSSLAEFKRSVQPLVLSGCATTACHGTAAGGGLMLYAPAEGDPVAYTNFYILTQYESRTAPRGNQGIFGSAMRRLVERGHGDSSLLANYGLPTNIAEFDHPLVGGRTVQPIFRNKGDQRYEQVVRWMDESLARIEPDYKLDFPLPRAGGGGGGGATTQPSTQPDR
jgi:hypothetical protein